MLKKASKLEFDNPYVSAIARAVVMVAISGGASVAVSEKKDTDTVLLEAKVTALENSIKELKDSNQQRWQRYYQNRAAGQDDHVCFERRFSRLESRINIEAPQCGHATVADAPAAMAEAAPVAATK